LEPATRDPKVTCAEGGRKNGKIPLNVTKKAIRIRKKPLSVEKTREKKKICPGGEKSRRSRGWGRHGRSPRSRGEKKK